MNNMEEHRKVVRENFIKSVNNVIKPMHDMLLAWEKLDHSDNSDTVNYNPFRTSFDEWFAEYIEWASQMEKIFNGRTFKFSPTVTAGELKKILENVDDSCQVVIGTRDWYTNIAEINLPNNYETYTVTMYLGTEFDTCQL